MTEAVRKFLAVFIGLALAAILVVVVEGVFLFLVKQRDAKTVVVHTPSTGFNEFRLTVGYRPQANAVVRAVKWVADETVYDVTYRFDEHHRRITPQARVAVTGPCLIFFGGSFAFGEGLNDDETLPATVAAKNGAFRVLNLGFSGYGPQQAVAQLQDDVYWDGACSEDSIGIYIYIPHHVRRAIGSMRVVSQWGLHFPYYALAEGGDVELLGSFERDRRRTTNFYRWIAREPILRFFEADLPLRLSDADYRLTADILAEAKAAFAARFHSERFYVLLYPQEEEMGRIIPFLQAEGVEVLDYSGLVDMSDPAMAISGDGHPTAKANDGVADALIRDLQVKTARSPQ